jgi:hypothetical protein
MIHVKWRFGTQIQYPAHLFDPDRAVESINGDGTTFGPNADGAMSVVRTFETDRAYLEERLWRLC